MSHPHLDVLRTFDESNLPDLDVAVQGALELFGEVSLPTLPPDVYKKGFVIGSGNAKVVGQILFGGPEAVFVDESTYEEGLAADSTIDAVVLISASGGKHAVKIAGSIREKGKDIWLITTNAEAPARQFVEDRKVVVFPKNREPYTYNTSTYMGMLLGKTGESPAALHEFILKDTASRIPDSFASYDAFYLIVPSRFIAMRDMFLTKFSELFGARVSARAFTLEQTKHAKTVVPSEKEMFVSFGEENSMFGSPENRLHVPLPKHASYGSMMAIGYYVIGHIQKQHPPYFKEHIGAYVTEASKFFESPLRVIVQ